LLRLHVELLQILLYSGWSPESLELLGSPSFFVRPLVSKVLGISRGHELLAPAVWDLALCQVDQQQVPAISTDR
jgi:hypothetical protein